MKKITVSLLIIALLTSTGVVISCGRSIKRELIPKQIIAKSSFGESSGGLVYLPVRLAIKEDYLFVVDAGNPGIQILKINSDGTLFPKFVFDNFDNAMEGLEELWAPDGLAIKEDYLFVADSHYNRIQVFKISPDGSLSPEFVFGKKGTGLGEFDCFLTLDLDIKEDYLFVADAGNSRIQVLRINSDGSLSPKFAFGKEGKGLGEFGKFSSEDGLRVLPTSLFLVVKEDYLFVSDPGNSRIQVFKIDPDGSLSPKFAFGKKGMELGEFKGPYGLATKEDYLFVADIGNSRIQVLKINSDGSLSPKFAFDKEDKGLGEVKTPFDLAIKENYLFVADPGNNRIQVLEIKY